MNRPDAPPIIINHGEVGRMRHGWLIAAGLLSAAASLLHVAIIIGGPDWYRFFGAGEQMAQAADHGAAMPGLVTAAIAAILAIWAFYAWSGAGLVRPLPLVRTGLVLITGIYLARGLALLPLIAIRPELVDTFLIASSFVSFGYGLTYAIGTWRAWRRLGARPSSRRR